MTKPNITITFTIDPDDVRLKVQATCDSMSRSEVLMALEKLKSKIESEEFDTHGTETPYNGAYYSENSFPLHESIINKELAPGEYKWLLYYGQNCDTYDKIKLDDSGRIDHAIETMFNLLEEQTAFNREAVEEIFWDRIKSLTHLKLK